MSPAPAPAHILRSHNSQINVVAFSIDNERLYSGDASGQIQVMSTRSFRPLASWKAHAEGILGIEEFNEDSVVTHGRDNKLHVWMRVAETKPLAETATIEELPSPSLKFSMDVNALNYCRFSLLQHSKGPSKNINALIALPNLVESSLADIWEIPSTDRLHAAIGKGIGAVGPGDGRGNNKTGIIMAMHLFRDTNVQQQLRLLLAYENGGVSLFTYSGVTGKSIEGRDWDMKWTVRSHVESVMAMTVRKDNLAAFTVSADNLVCRYDLQDDVAFATRSTVYRTKHPGNGAIVIQDDGRVIAIGGWDGKVRLYSSKTFKYLGSLAYHKEGCQAAAFPHYQVGVHVDGDDELDDFDNGDVEDRLRWLVTGGKDTRIAVWRLRDFDKK
ncbi:WD-40 repeat-containing protein [Hysterangium stoloniferum]|nr:WD-40 repeat-containing protein [Hysterangium stoloniferum]